jgi:hypothetical protein
MTMIMPRQDFYKRTREPVIGHMPAFAKRPGGNVVEAGGRMTDASGEINAYDNNDLAQKINAIYAMSVEGQVGNGAGFEDPAAEQAKLTAKKERHEAFVSAYHSGEQEGTFKVAAEVFAEDVWETLNRQGFTPQLVARKDVVDGQDNRIRKRRKDVVAFQVVNDGQGIAQIVEQDYIYPQDYYLQCQILIEERELAQAGPEFLDEKFQDALEAIMVRQDRILRNLFLRTSGVFNAPVSFATFTPQVLTALRTQVVSNGIPAAHMLFSFDIWDDMIADPTFTSWWEPVHKYQLIMEGKLGTLLNMKLITDGFRYQTQKVLEPGEVFVLGTPIALGQRGVRRNIQAVEINHFPLGAPRRGMYLYGLESLHIEDRPVGIGTRV